VSQFLDTSVFVAAFWRGHPHHMASLRLVSAAARKTTFCGLHTLAEIYATMTALPVKQQIHPDQALLFIQDVRERATIVTLDETEYVETIARVAGLGYTSGRIYDALLLRCAAKVKADTIYTWNLKHFLSIDSKLAVRVRTP
jgi:predicted nucleic acid-binding protein